MARKRSVNCAANGRDSKGQNLGVKAWGSQVVTTGSVIVRQKGTRFFPGPFTKMGRDHTIYAAADGQIQFGWRAGGKRTISIIPPSK